MGCGSSLQAKNSVAPELEIARFSEKEKSFLTHTYRDIMKNKPDLFHKMFVASIRKSIRLNEVIALGQYCARDLTKWPRLHQLSKTVEAYVEKLIYDFKLDEPTMIESLRGLGRRHFAYAKYGLQPVHWDICVHSFLVSLAGAKVGDEERKARMQLIYRRFMEFIVREMSNGYQEKKAEQMRLKKTTSQSDFGECITFNS